MATLKSIKKRIVSVKNTQKITKAMKMVAAAKLRRAQEAVNGARPYAETLQAIIQDISAKSQGEKQGSPLFVAREEVKTIGVFVCTSNRGLCGSFNSALLRQTLAWINEKIRAGVNVKVFVAGRKGRDFFNSRKVEVVEANPAWAEKMSFEAVQELSARFTQEFLDGSIDEFTIVYNRFYSALRQVPTFEQILPLSIGEKKEVEESYGIDFIFEPSKQEILADILPKFLATQVYKSHLESLASELGARMSAMDSATSNASDMIGRLTLSYNRLRQAAITTELMDIVNGAESLK